MYVLIARRTAFVYLSCMYMFHIEHNLSAPPAVLPQLMSILSRSSETLKERHELGRTAQPQWVTNAFHL